MKDDSEAQVKSAISEVESEQGSFESAGSEPPKNFGHDSAPSAGVGGNLGPGKGGGK